MNNSWITRWILGIQEFDIIHCKGTKNIVADILSQYPEDMSNQRTINCDDKLEINACRIQISKEIKNKLKNIKQYQQTDDKLTSIIRAIKSDGAENVMSNY